MKNDLVGFKPEFWVYSSPDGSIKIQANLQGETLWLSAMQMSELFGIDISGIRKHLKNIFESGELERDSVSAFFASTASDGKTYKIEYYNLDAVISVGYRVNSIIGTRFRIWATQRLKEYLIKGFTMNDELLKQAGVGSYFDELLARIRDIRSSEKVFWRKVLDIYSTSIDYDPRTETSREFFKVIQNKMHWASHGHTAAEIVFQRADSTKANMGLSSWSGDTPRKADIEIAKNYLNETELEVLNRIVTLYLDFAELQALDRKPMYMKDWVVKLDEFLSFSGREILQHAGKIAHEDALQKARLEYEKWYQTELEKPSLADKHFVEAMNEIKQISLQSKAKRKK
jgi:hypothetical protein